MRSHVGRAALCAFAVGATQAHAQESAPPDAPAAGPLTAGECAVWAALGRVLYGWGRRPAPKQQFKIFYRPAPGGGYLQQCDWRRFSVTPPPPGDFDVTAPWTGFSTPVRRGRVYTVEVIDAAPWGTSWGVRSMTCRLVRARGAWTRRSCREDAVT